MKIQQKEDEDLLSIFLYCYSQLI